VSHLIGNATSLARPKNVMCLSTSQGLKSEAYLASQIIQNWDMIRGVAQMTMNTVYRKREVVYHLVAITAAVVRLVVIRSAQIACS
jgi:hypothetical protein